MVVLVKPIFKFPQTLTKTPVLKSTLNLVDFKWENNFIYASDM